MRVCESFFAVFIAFRQLICVLRVCARASVCVLLLLFILLHISYYDILSTSFWAILCVCMCTSIYFADVDAWAPVLLLLLFVHILLFYVLAFVLLEAIYEHNCHFKWQSRDKKRVNDSNNKNHNEIKGGGDEDTLSRSNDVRVKQRTN